MLATRTEIESFIPQRNPFVAVHEILKATDELLISQFEVLAENIFVTGGILHEAGLIENIAQTAAAQMGYVCKQKGIPVPIGYIASIKNLKVYKLPPTGSVLSTSVQVTNRVMDFMLVDGKIRSGENNICECEMRIFVEPTKA